MGKMNNLPIENISNFVLKYLDQACPKYSKELNGESTLNIDVSSIVKTGIYTVSLQSNSEVSTKKLIVR